MWTSDDLLSGLLQLAAWLAVLGAVVCVAIWWARRRRSTTLALTVTRMMAGFMLGLIGIGIVAGGINHLAAAQVWLDDGVRHWVTEHQSSITSSPCEVAESLSGSSTAPIAYCDGVILHVPFPPRLVIFTGMLLSLLAGTAIVWSIYTAAFRAGMREPFHPSVPRTFRLAAVVVLATVVVGDVFTTIGMTLAARSLEWSPGVTVPFVFQPPVWPLAVALGLFALSAIFRYGARPQRETEGLI